MIASKSKDAIKLNIIKLNKSKTYPTEEVLSEDGLYISILIHINCNLVRDMEIEGDDLDTDFIWSKYTYRLD